MSWPEGDMAWARYDHVLPPGSRSCAEGLVWDGVALSSSGRHSGAVGLLPGDGPARAVKDSLDPAPWKVLEMIVVGEAIPGDSY